MIFGIVILLSGFTAGVMFAQDHNVTFTWEPQNPKINESVKFTVSAPGAEKVRLFRNNMCTTWDGESGSMSTTFINVRSLDVTATALYDGVWTPMTPVRTINFPITGYLAKINVDFPPSIALSSSLTFSFAKIANAEKYEYCIYAADDYCHNSDSISAADYSGQTISITTDKTKDLPAGEYVFEISGRTPGYYKTESHYIFEIGNSSQSLPPAPTVSIAKNRFTLGSQELLGLTINAEGATKIRYYMSTPDSYYKEEVNNLSDIDKIARVFSEPGDYFMRFSALINGKWSPYSDPVQFTLVSKGVGPRTTFSIPTAVETGGTLSISIEPVSNVDYYVISVNKSDEGSSHLIKSTLVTTTDQPTEILMDNVEPGQYTVSVSCRREGYEYVSSYLPLTVTPSDFVLPVNLTAISSYAFSNAGMKSVTIPKNVNTISAHAFEGCNNLTSVSIANGPTSIGEYAFANNPKLSKVTIPNSVQSIADSAFSNCSNLTTIKAPYGSSAAEWAQSHGFSVEYN